VRQPSPSKAEQDIFLAFEANHVLPASLSNPQTSANPGTIHPFAGFSLIKQLPSSNFEKFYGKNSFHSHF
jgi:hypothetical protein